MTQEEKQLLLKDLCSRLPYGVIIKSISGDDYGRAVDICYPQGVVAYMGQKMDAYSEEFLPYLRPLSSMKEEEEQYVLDTWSEDSFNNGIDLMYDNYMMLGYASDFIDWLNAHHFDYRGLIEKGLALEAPEGMYKTE